MEHFDYHLCVWPELQNARQIRQHHGIVAGLWPRKAQWRASEQKPRRVEHGRVFVRSSEKRSKSVVGILVCSPKVSRKHNSVKKAKHSTRATIDRPWRDIC